MAIQVAIHNYSQLYWLGMYKRYNLLCMEQLKQPLHLDIHAGSYRIFYFTIPPWTSKQTRESVTIFTILNDLNAEKILMFQIMKQQPHAPATSESIEDWIATYIANYYNHIYNRKINVHHRGWSSINIRLLFIDFMYFINISICFCYIHILLISWLTKRFSSLPIFIFAICKWQFHFSVMIFAI